MKMDAVSMTAVSPAAATDAVIMTASDVAGGATVATETALCISCDKWWSIGLTPYTVRIKRAKT